MSDSILSIKDASGRQFSLLNDNNSATTATTTTTSNNIVTSMIMTSPRITRPFKVDKLSPALSQQVSAKRKYHCAEPGCNKSFTTSGHLARHNRIHTGEKNFHCLHPGCPSRFSRQDNMMQHYRTHLSQKMRRQKEKISVPRLHSHSYHGGEHHMPQPLTRPRRATTMPSMPYPPPSLLSSSSSGSRYASSYKPFTLDPTTSPLESLKTSKLIGRPRRALSTSSSCSSSSSSGSPTILYSPPTPQYHHPHYQQQQQQQHQQQQHFYQSIPMLPIPHHHYSLKHPQYHHHYTQQKQQQQQKEQDQWTPASPKPLSGLLHLANIVSTFG